MDESDVDAALTRSPGTSLHRQLFVILRDQILRGVYPAGAMIPNEETLGAQFGVSRITVRRAVSDLESQKLLEKRPGRGTFVSRDVPPRRPSATLGLVESLRKTATETQVTVVSVEVTEPPLEIAQQLDLLPGAKALSAVRLRRRGLTPVMVTEAWIPAKLGVAVTVEALERQPLYEILIAQGVVFGRVIQEVTAVAASPFYAKLLDTELGAPLLRLSRLLYDTAQRPVQHLTVYVSPERSRLLMDVSIGAVNTPTAGSFYHDVPERRPDADPAIAFG